MYFKWVATIALAALAMVGNYLSFEIFPGIDLLFGSIAAFVALRLFGIGPGCLVAFLGATVTYFDWGHPYSVVVFTLEIAVVGLLSKRTDNLVLADAVYWLLLGISTVVLFYAGFMGVATGSAIYIALQQTVNGVLNAAVAAFLLEIGRVYVPAIRRRLSPVSFRTLMSYLVVGIIMGASTLFVLAQTHAAYARAITGMNTAMNLLANWADYELNEADGDEAPVRAAYQERVSNVLSRLDGRNFPLSNVAVGVVYSDGQVSSIAGILRSTSGSGQIVEGLSGVTQWEPPGDLPEVLRARERVYVVRTASQFVPSEREIVVEISAAPLIDLLEAGGRGALALLASILLGVLIFSRLLTNGATRQTEQFVRMSDGLLDNIMQGRPSPKISKTGITELDAIGGVLHSMSLQLARTFGEQQELTITLEDRVRQRTSELELLSQVAKQTTNAVVVTDTCGKVTWINEACTRLTGFCLEDMRGKAPGEVLQKVPPPEAILENMRHGIRNTQGFHVEVVNSKKDGTPYWVEISCSPIFDKAGIHKGFIAIESDVTERRKTSQALQESVERLNLATTMANMGIWTYDSATQTVEWNDENSCLHGIPQAAEDKYERWENAVHPDDLRVIMPLLRSSQPDDEVDLEFEYRFLHPELGERLISSRVKVTSVTKDGSLCYTGTNLDMTDIRKASQQLQHAAAKTAAILDNALDSIITIDGKGQISSFNRAAEAMFGYPADEVMGENVSILMSAEHSGHHSNYIQSYLKGRKPRMIGQVTEIEAKRANGDVFPVELAVSESTDETGAIFIGILRDLTERHKIDRMKSEFLAMVSHELRTPLTSIQGTLHLIKAGIFGDLDPRGQKLVGSSLDNAEALGGMVDEILDLEKLTSGKLEVHVGQVHLKDLLTRTINSIQPYSDKFSVHVKLDNAVPDVSVQADLSRSIQVLTNFISNAVKFSPVEGVVRVRATQNNGSIRVSVVDDGPGIPEDKHGMLFQKFSQLDASDSRKHRGTGLGLAISRELMESMGGQIGFFSAEGEGATFWAEFPISVKAKQKPQRDDQKVK